ncbi:L-lysine 2,3-aminomutase KamA [Gottschalkia acidurici 9a]|uniref:L-lysine 2,3-aminomutase KamA n=2 Tax=Clostridium acidurici TaxID=1556 RepID=K0AXJ8_GOTA9|nr:L-lysine 2,3-aminomutase KamA [Gottschalkia acidurici 9a]
MKEELWMDRTIKRRQIALDRAKELKSRIQDYLDAKKNISKGMSLEQEKKVKEKQKLLSILNATEDDWNNYKWQLSNRISDVNILTQVISLDAEEIEGIKNVEKSYRWGISPYYLSLIDDDNKLDPIKLQSIPTSLELLGEGIDDPMGEEFTNPAGSITRRYPDRLIINVTNECAMYCRHCQRRRNIGSCDNDTSIEALKESIDYIKENPEIRDVLITGGDALALSDERLDWLLGEIHAIPSVEYIRLGTRTLVTLPQRITDNLVNILKKYPPLYINTQFNHPMEITKEVKKACDKLSLSGIPLGNQAVLLNGVNNDKYVMRLLNHELLKCRIRPYYIFHAKEVIGTTHFNTSVDDGIEIVEYLRGYTSGMAVPTYILNAPDGDGKTPIAPQYLISRGKDSIKIRTWEGKVVDYPNNPTQNLEKLL